MRCVHYRADQQMFLLFIERSQFRSLASAMPLPRSKSHKALQDRITTYADSKFRIGQRIKMSPLGAARCPRLRHKTGNVIGFTKYKSRVAIIFDGNKAPIAIHINYIEAIKRSRRLVELGLKVKNEYG
jgi:hypothetical protein